LETRNLKVLLLPPETRKGKTEFEVQEEIRINLESSPE
jgi:hypothetical protein